MRSRPDVRAVMRDKPVHSQYGVSCDESTDHCIVVMLGSSSACASKAVRREGSRDPPRKLKNGRGWSSLRQCSFPAYRHFASSSSTVQATTWHTVSLQQVFTMLKMSSASGAWSGSQQSWQSQDHLRLRILYPPRCLSSQ